MKAGHFNAGITIETGRGTPRQTLDPVEPEFVNAIEIGLKSTWWDDRIDLSAAFFRYWYSDLQVFDIVNEKGAIPTQQLLNADANVKGVEVETSITPITGLLLQAGFAWLDSRFGEFIVSKQVASGFAKGGPPRTVEFDYTGNPLIAAPEFSLSGIVEYEIPLSRWGALVPRFDFSWKSRTNLDPSNEELISQAPYTLFNARLAYRTPDGRVEVAGWVQNFTDVRYKVDVFDVSRQFRMVTEIYGYPRSFGVTTSYNF
jgi:iron complex outermembrane receptor protein